MTPGSGPSDSDKQVAQAAARGIGATGRPQVVRVYDEKESTHVDVMIVADAPSRGLSTFSTLGLHWTVNLLDGKDIRVELVAVAFSTAEEVASLLGNAAFLVMKQAWLAAPGVVYPDLVTDYGLSDTLPHLLLTAPFPFPELNAIEVDGGPTVHWLMAVPVSGSERQYLVANGLDAFEQLLEQAKVAYWDFTREPVV